MFSPLHSYLEREHMGMYTVATAMASGLAVEIDATVTTPLAGSIYGAIYGNVVVASPVITGTNNTTTLLTFTEKKELGWLLQPVSTSGPTLLNILTQVYDESVAAGQTAVVAMSKAGALIATDQYVAAGGTKIAFDGSVALGSLCGITAGQPRVLQALDSPRLKFLGKVVQRNLALAAFQIL